MYDDPLLDALVREKQRRKRGEKIIKELLFEIRRLKNINRANTIRFEKFLEEANFEIFKNPQSSGK